jgi:ribosomal protein S20
MLNMPITKSAKKALRQNIKRRKTNIQKKKKNKRPLKGCKEISF